MTQPPERRAQELFALARAEKPSQRVRARVLGLRTKAWRLSAGMGVGSLMALAAGAVLFAAREGSRERPPNSIVPEGPVATAFDAAPRAASAPRGESPAAASAAARELVKAAPPTVTKAPASQAPLTLAAELGLLEEARNELARGAPARALELLAQYGKSVRGGRLQAEATLLRIEALTATGRTAEARRLAREFPSRHPGSPLVDRARGFAENEESIDQGGTP